MNKFLKNTNHMLRSGDNNAVFIITFENGLGSQELDYAYKRDVYLKMLYDDYVENCINDNYWDKSAPNMYEEHADIMRYISMMLIKKYY